jgi:predicted RNase H-like nuclease
MNAILGIDAAWTPNHPSGVALIRQTESGKWESVAVAESYQAFLSLPKLPSTQNVAGKIPVRGLIDKAKELAGVDITLVAADIPLSREPILGRRYADDLISRLFGSLGCSAHSPSVVRPGRISEEIRDGFQKCGFQLATSTCCLPEHALIETFPHPALLSLMNTRYRLAYKVAKSTKYWPNSPRAARMAMLLRNFQDILATLSREISKIDCAIRKDATSFSALKGTEDKIDALVCAWVGIQAMEGRAVAIGNEKAAIWLPSDLRSLVRPKDWSVFLESAPMASPDFMDGVEDLPVQERTFFAEPKRRSTRRSAPAQHK